MSYKRKTYDVFNIQGDYGQGFETVTCEETWPAARQVKRVYQENEPNVIFRIKISRERIEMEEV